jgi:NAD(P)-dependent dehydrogenase (short-subunit alcohol dehydrogenase family)
MFKSKTILITGGSSGIGEATALMFAQNGANIAITYKSNKSGAEKVIEKAQKLGVKAIAVQADLIDEKEVKNAVERVVKELGKIDVLVNNAGRYVEGDEWNGTSDIWMKSLQQNLVSMMNISKYVVEHFQKQKSGVMINIASVHGLDGQPDAISYAAAKAGVINITQSYAKLLTPFGRANSICPGATNAGYWLTAPKEELEEKLAKRPSHKLVPPENIAKKAIFLVSNEAKDINGKNFVVNE